MRARVLDLALALTSVLALAGAGAQQPGGAQGGGYVYDLYQGATVIGQVGAAFGAGETGHVSEGWTVIGTVIDISDRLATNPDGSAVAYLVEGTFQGVQFSIEAEFDATGVGLRLEQFGVQQDLRLGSAEALYVIDNNLIDGIQVAVWHALGSGADEVVLAAIVPQTASLGEFRLQRHERLEAIAWQGATLQATRLDAALSVAGQVVGMTIWADERGDILVLEQPLGAIRFVRRAQEGAAGAAVADPAASSSGTEARVAPDPLTSAAALLAQTATCAYEREVTVGSTGETLAGVLTLPAAPRGADLERGVPALLLLPGSGGVDIDGNAQPVIANAGYRQLAYSLGCHGYAVLRVAKLGIPPSTGDGNAVTVSTYAQNTADWLARLAAEPGIDGDRLGLMGHSEGGLVALFAIANRLADPQALVLLAAPGRGMAAILEEQLAASLQRAGGSAAEIQAIREETRVAVAALQRVDGHVLELSAELADNRVAALFAHAAGLMRSELELQPDGLMRVVRALGRPDPRRVLIVQGAKDVQIILEDAELLAAAAPEATLLVLPDMTHNLYDFAGPADIGLMPGPDTAISDTLVRSLVTFLDGHLRVPDR